MNFSTNAAAARGGRRTTRPGALAGRLALALAVLGAAACSAAPRGSAATPTVAPEATPRPDNAPTLALTRTLTPPPAPQTLNLCISAEPESLYAYRAYTGRATHLAAEHVRQALFDGPIDSVGFEQRPVILEELPTLENGGAVLEPATVATGERYYDAATGRVTEWREAEAQLPRLSMTYTLRPDLLWSDGGPLAADDSVFAFELLAGTGADLTMQPAELLALAQRTAAYEALDELTVRWTGLPGYAERFPLNTFATFISPLPRHLLGDDDPSQMTDNPGAARQPTGWGPYVLADWAAGESITLKRNPLYFRAAEGLPRAETIIFRFVPDVDEALSAIGRGQTAASPEGPVCDAALHDAFGLQQADLIPAIDAAAAQGELAVQYQVDAAWEHLDFDLSPLDGRPAFFAEAAVRQAVARCLDRQALADAVYPGHGAVAGGQTPPASPYLAAEAGGLYPYDPHAGRGALAEAGWAAGVSGPAERDGVALQVELVLAQGRAGQTLAGLIVGNLAACGIEVRPRFVTPEEISGVGAISPIFHREFDLALFAWRGGLDGAPRCDLYISQEIPSEENGWLGDNATGYANPEYDAACAEARQAGPADASRAAHLHGQSLLARDLPSLPLFHRLQWLVARPDLRGLHLAGLAVDELRSELVDIETLSLAQ